MGNFKLGSNRPNVLKENGFLNKSPFTDNGNTMAYNNGEGDPPKKPSTQAETDKAAEKNVVFDESTRTEIKSDKPGFQKFRTTGTGDAEGYVKGTEKMGNKEWSEWLKTTAGQKYTASKNKEKFDYVAKPGKEPTEKMVITTSENPRKKKTQDYIAGEGDKVFSAIYGHRAEKLSGGLSRLAGKRKDVTMFGQKNNISKKDLARQKSAYDAKVMASRAKKGKYGAQHLTIAEQEAKENINQLGGGRSSIGDTETGVGQTSKNQTFRKDAQGNMQIQTLNNRGKVIKSESTSPKNDIVPEKTINKANATTLSGRETVVTTSKV